MVIKMKKILYLIVILSMTIQCFTYKKETVMVEMSDGVKLFTVIFTPDDTSDYPLPVILRRTPYNAINTDYSIGKKRCCKIYR